MRVQKSARKVNAGVGSAGASRCPRAALVTREREGEAAGASVYTPLALVASDVVVSFIYFYFFVPTSPSLLSVRVCIA